LLKLALQVFLRSLQLLRGQLLVLLLLCIDLLLLFDLCCLLLLIFWCFLLWYEAFSSSWRRISSYC
jgi:hypothetical protein